MFGKLLSGIKKAIGKSEVKSVLSSALQRVDSHPLIPKDASETLYAGIVVGMFCILDELLRRDVVDQPTYDECSDMLEKLYRAKQGELIESDEAPVAPKPAPAMPEISQMTSTKTPGSASA